MHNFWIYFNRTLAFMDFLKLDINVSLNKLETENTSVLKNQLFAFIDSQTRLTKKVLDALREIVAIEIEKKSLKSGKVEREKIFGWEFQVYQLRERLLKEGIMGFAETKFGLNPYLRTYESDWDWNFGGIELSSEQCEKIVTADKGDYFFVLLQTGSYDNICRTNVLELPLTDYHNFMLNLFQTPRTLVSAIDFFEKEFNPISEKEVMELRGLTVGLLNELIFKTLIVATLE